MDKLGNRRRRGDLRPHNHHGLCVDGWRLREQYRVHRNLFANYEGCRRQSRRRITYFECTCHRLFTDAITRCSLNSKGDCRCYFNGHRPICHANTYDDTVHHSNYDHHSFHYPITNMDTHADSNRDAAADHHTIPNMDTYADSNRDATADQHTFTNGYTLANIDCLH